MKKVLLILSIMLAGCCATNSCYLPTAEITEMYAQYIDEWKSQARIAFEEAEKNPSFRKIYDSWQKFRSEIMLWHRFAEQTYANFVLNNPVRR